MARRPRTALLAASACAAFAVLVWALAFHTHAGRAADASAFLGFLQLDATRVAQVADWIARACNPLPYAMLCIPVVWLAHRTRGPRGVLATGAILVAANVATKHLKPALADPRPLAYTSVAPASWPSGHSTAAMALALCLVIAAPPVARRLLAVVGGLFAVAVAYSVVLLGWHYPSDALGGFAVAGTAASLAVAGLWWTEARWPAGAGRRATTRALGGRAAVPAALPAAALSLMLLAIGVLRTASWLPSTRQQGAFVAFAGGIAVLAVGLAAACSRAVRPARERRNPARDAA